MCTKAITRVATVLLVVGACLGGCDTAPARIKPDPVLDYPQKVALEGLDKAVVAARPIVTPSTADRPMQVSVPLRSIVDGRALNVQYKFEFFDQNGRPLRTNLGWRFQKLEPRVQVFLEGNALETKAVDWRLQVRPAR